MGEEALFSWVHLSDIHFGHGDPSHRWDQRLVLREIARDLRMARQDGLGIPAPDAVLVTGDIAFSGNSVVRAPATTSTEYADAKAWLQEIAGNVGLGPGQVFLVPGNHDVDRSKDRDRNTGRLVRGLQAGSDKLDDVLAHAGDRAALAGRMSAYLDFAQGFAPHCLAPAKPPEERLFWTRGVDARRGLRVRLVGLNTALLSSGDEDLGHLQVGGEQLARAFAEPPIADEGELVIVLGHHPFRAWLADAVDVERTVRRHAHLHLSGHVHEAESEESRTGGASHGLLRVVAGASHAERQASKEIPAGHGYNWAAIFADDEGRLELRIWPRKWSDNNRDFRPDVERIQRGKPYARHELPVKVAPRPAIVEPGPTKPPWPRDVGEIVSTFIAQAAPPRPPAVATAPSLAPEHAWLPKTGPLKLVISWAIEDEAEVDKLRKHLAPLKRRGYFEVWDQSLITAGSDRRHTIAQKLAEAHVIAPLISPAYFASSCFDDELEVARKRHEASNVLVIPVLLKPSDVKLEGEDQLWFEGLACVPTSAITDKVVKEYKLYKPVTAWDDTDEALTRVVTELKELIEETRRRGS